MIIVTSLRIMDLTICVHLNRTNVLTVPSLTVGCVLNEKKSGPSKISLEHTENLFISFDITA